MSFRPAGWAVAEAAVAAALVAPLAAQRWETKYLYDQDKTGLVFTDLTFPSAQRGVAVGFITDGKHDQPVSLVTSDSGRALADGCRWRRCRSPCSFSMRTWAGW